VRHADALSVTFCEGAIVYQRGYANAHFRPAGCWREIFP
jgi:hypothetical protein